MTINKPLPFILHPDPNTIYIAGWAEIPFDRSFENRKHYAVEQEIYHNGESTWVCLQSFNSFMEALEYKEFSDRITSINTMRRIRQY
jgi:hypothetical protein